MVLLVFLFYTVCNSGKFLTLGLDTVRSESVKRKTGLQSADGTKILFCCNAITWIQIMNGQLQQSSLSYQRLFLPVLVWNRIQVKENNLGSNRPSATVWSVGGFDVLIKECLYVIDRVTKT